MYPASWYAFGMGAVFEALPQEAVLRVASLPRLDEQLLDRPDVQIDGTVRIVLT